MIVFDEEQPSVVAARCAVRSQSADVPSRSVALATGGDHGRRAEQRSRRRRRLRSTAVVVVAIGGIVVALGPWFARQVQSPNERAAKAAPPAPTVVTSAAVRRVLSEGVVARGDVKPSESFTVTIGGTPAGESSAVVTGIRVQQGGAVVEGDVLGELSGRPIIVVAGDVPFYRDLRPGQSGRDVAQLQAALNRLGFTDAETDGTFGAGTKAAVVAWYAKLGYESSKTSPDAMAQRDAAARDVASAEANAAAAKRALDDASRPKPRSVLLEADAAVAKAARALEIAQLHGAQEVARAGAERDRSAAALAAARAAVPADGATVAAAAAALDAAEGDVAVASRRAAVDEADAADQIAIARAAADEAHAPIDLGAAEAAANQAQRVLDTATTTRSLLEASTGAIVPLTEVVAVPILPARVDRVGAVIGARPDGPIMVLASGGYVVEARLSGAARKLVPAGTSATVTDEMTGRTYVGRVTAAADQSSSAPEAGGAPGYLVRVTTDEPIDPASASANVKVTLAGSGSTDVVLAVPVAAVSARADGSVEVTRVRAGVEERIVVTVGSSAGGFVAIVASQPTLEPGDEVVVGR